ncbi:MAG: hypothetical protein ACYC1U_06830 [Candidatus Aquicultorales bacterium]
MSKKQLLEYRLCKLILEARSDGRKTITFQEAMVGDAETANGRVYPWELLKAEALRIQAALAEGGELDGVFTGEAEHPQNKPTWRPNILETVVKWTEVLINEAMKTVGFKGVIANTEAGRDLAELADLGVKIGGSSRSQGLTEYRLIGGRDVEFVTEFILEGYDLVKDPAVGRARATIESLEGKEGNDMKLTLEQLRTEHPELYESLVKQLEAKVLEGIQAKNKAGQEAAIREALGLKEGDNVLEAIKTIAESQKKLTESQQKLEAEKTAAEVAKAIDESTKDLPYGDKLKTQFVEAVKAAKPENPEAVKTVVETKKGEYDAIVAAARLESKGYGASFTGSVFEKETGQPEFAKPSFKLAESVERRYPELRVPKEMYENSPAGRFAALVLEKFDKAFERELVNESGLVENMGTSDLNLPYSVARTIIREAVPRLVALNVFDAGVTDQSPTRLYFEDYSDEAGVENAIVAEEVTFAAGDGQVQPLAHANVKRGTVTAVLHAGGALVEGTDYLVDYGLGQVWRIPTGGIAEAGNIHVSYTYAAVREGEMAAIERGKQTYTYKTLEIEADRLAVQVSAECVKFARSQLGEDAQARAMAGVIRQVQTYIDRRLFSLAEFAVRRVTDNSGGTWSIAGGGGLTFDKWLVTLERYIGIARTKVVNRYYEPNAIVMSASNADMVGNSERFRADGQNGTADIDASGYVGRLKGLPVFQTTELNDAIIMVVNRELVQHRVFSPLQLKGPFPTYSATGKLISADQFYVEEFNGTDTPKLEKGAYVLVTA